MYSFTAYNHTHFTVKYGTDEDKKRRSDEVTQFTNYKTNNNNNNNDSE